MLIASRDRRRGHRGALSVPIYNVDVLSELSYWNEDLNPASCVCPEIIGYEVIFEAWGVAVAGWSIGTPGFGRSPMHALADPKGGHHLAGGWVDDGVPIDYDGWDHLVAVSHGSDEGGCVGIFPDVDLVY